MPPGVPVADGGRGADGRRRTPATWPSPSSPWPDEGLRARLQAKRRSKMARGGAGQGRHAARQAAQAARRRKYDRRRVAGRLAPPPSRRRPRQPRPQPRRAHVGAARALAPRREGGRGRAHDPRPAPCGRSPSSTPRCPLYVDHARWCGCSSALPRAACCAAAPPIPCSPARVLSALAGALAVLRARPGRRGARGATWARCAARCPRAGAGRRQPLPFRHAGAVAAAGHRRHAARSRSPTSTAARRPAASRAGARPDRLHEVHGGRARCVPCLVAVVLSAARGGVGGSGAVPGHARRPRRRRAPRDGRAARDRARPRAGRPPPSRRRRACFGRSSGRLRGVDGADPDRRWRRGGRGRRGRRGEERPGRGRLARAEVDHGCDRRRDRLRRSPPPTPSCARRRS